MRPIADSPRRWNLAHPGLVHGRLPRIVPHQGSEQPETCLDSLVAYAEEISRTPEARRFTSEQEIVDWLWRQPVHLDTGDGRQLPGCRPTQRSNLWPRHGLNCWEALAHYLGVLLALREPLEVHVFDAPVQGQRHVFPAVRPLGSRDALEPVVLQPPVETGRTATRLAQCINLWADRAQAVSLQELLDPIVQMAKIGGIADPWGEAWSRLPVDVRQQVLVGAARLPAEPGELPVLGEVRTLADGRTWAGNGEIVTVEGHAYLLLNLFLRLFAEAERRGYGARRELTYPDGTLNLTALQEQVVAVVRAGLEAAPAATRQAEPEVSPEELARQRRIAWARAAEAEEKREKAARDAKERADVAARQGDYQARLAAWQAEQDANAAYLKRAQCIGPFEDEDRAQAYRPALSFYQVQQQPGIRPAGTVRLWWSRGHFRDADDKTADLPTFQTDTTVYLPVLTWEPNGAFAAGVRWINGLAWTIEGYAARPLPEAAEAPPHVAEPTPPAGPSPEEVAQKKRLEWAKAAEAEAARDKAAREARERGDVEARRGDYQARLAAWEAEQAQNAAYVREAPRAQAWYNDVFRVGHQVGTVALDVTGGLFGVNLRPLSDTVADLAGDALPDEARTPAQLAQRRARDEAARAEASAKNAAAVASLLSQVPAVATAAPPAPLPETPIEDVRPRRHRRHRRS